MSAGNLWNALFDLAAIKEPVSMDLTIDIELRHCSSYLTSCASFNESPNEIKCTPRISESMGKPFKTGTPQLTRISEDFPVLLAGWFRHET